ncbi:MAG: hypothetical protein EOP04_12505 [Proteobacteria bacterium]|nr:MAG: hypothetical protein EOP04_12505 [Pseudomonadota bacterium]
MQISKLVLSMTIAAAAMTSGMAHAKTSTSCANQRGVAMLDRTTGDKAPVASAPAKKPAPMTKAKSKR